MQREHKANAEALVFLEKFLPISAILFGGMNVALSENKLIFALLTLGYIIVNVLLSKLLHNKSGKIYWSLEFAKTTLSCFYVSFIPLFVEQYPIFWTLNLVYLFRVCLIYYDRRTRILNCVYIGVVPSIALYLFHFNFSDILLPAVTFSALGILISTIIEFMNEQSKRLAHTSKLASMGEMASGVAHEINNPLSIITGSASVINKSLDNHDRVTNEVDRIKKSVDRISKIIIGMRKFSRKSEKLTKSYHSLSSLVDESLLIINTKLKEHNVPIEVIEFNPITIYCDELKISQIIVNLISNAIDESSKQENPWIKIKAFTDNSNVNIIVIDSGHGIKKEIQDKLFNPFFTTKDIGKGTGIGLSISKSLAEEHDGSLEYKLIDGHTAFVLKVPK